MKTQGYQPGIRGTFKYFKTVDSLYLLDGFTTDSAGIFKVNDNARNYLRNYLISKANDKHLSYSSDSCLNEVYSIGESFKTAANFPETNAFSAFIASLKKKVEKTNLDSAYLTYLQAPINEDGFRSIPFKNYKTNKKKVLLLGDSFTWGHSAENITSSFADHLSAKGHVVFNTGISGADIPQYMTVAKTYLKVLEPDIVIVNLYLGNDISEHDRAIGQDYPLLYPTNAGNLYATAYGLFLPHPDSVYQHILDRITIPRQEENLFNRWMAKTRVTTFLWRGLGLTPLVDSRFSSAYLSTTEHGEKSTIGYSVNRKYLEQIAQLCQQHQAKLIVSIIPTNNNLNISDEEISILLDGFEFQRFKAFRPSDYLNQEDGHFNDVGHARYADFLDGLIL